MLPAKKNATPKQAAFWSTKSKEFNDYGQYPKGFIAWALRMMSHHNPATVLHVCAGGVNEGITVDIRPETNPDIVADGRALPLADNTVECVMIDPPYYHAAAENLYGVEYPEPKDLLAEAARVALPGAPIGFLHPMVNFKPRGTRIESCTGITQGLGFYAKAFVVYRVL